ncbi:hypothetical protein PoB_000006900 [Plakobranchus ocellatus]|uniref:Uncharacterized protein n=1 Tax=Plakobranchus ocellatus TaxID=259542 RepID=A0AAV3XUB2_9GAST|nr:hypothetical protein PoB_000006900 [Plakobranchus ocellatus]
MHSVSHSPSLLQHQNLEKLFLLSSTPGKLSDPNQLNLASCFTNYELLSFFLTSPLRPSVNAQLVPGSENHRLPGTNQAECLTRLEWGNSYDLREKPIL